MHGFEIAAIDRAGNSGRDSRSLTVDTRAPEPVVSSDSGTGTFAFDAAEAGSSFECRLEGLTDFAPCTSPATFALAPGDYTFELRAVDAAGNRSPSVRRAFTVAAPQPATDAGAGRDPAPGGDADPDAARGRDRGRAARQRPDPRQAAELERVRRALAIGRHPGRLGGQRQERAGRADDRAGRRASRSSARVFYAGIFKLSQPGATLDLTLSEPLAACKKNKRASAADGKAKTRKLWGDGKGKFRTRGRYSSATVRGTIWLVQDTCDGHADAGPAGRRLRARPQEEDVLVRAGRSYLAKPRR